MTEAVLRAAEGRATIRTDELDLGVGFAQGLRLTHLVTRRAGTDWIPQPPEYPWGQDRFHEALSTRSRRDIWPDLAPPSSEFLLHYRSGIPPGAESSLEAAGSLGPLQVVTGASPCRIVPGHCSAAGGGDEARLDLTVAPEGHPVEITVHTRVHDGPAVVRRSATVRNTGDRPLRLERLSSLHLSLRPSPADLELTWVEAFVVPFVTKAAERWREAAVRCERLGPLVRRTLRYGVYSRPQEGGSQGCLGWAALHDPVLAQGLYLGWDWSGPYDVEIGDFEEGAGVFGIRAGVSGEGGYWRELPPGGTYTSPEAFFGFYTGDREEAGRATRGTAERLFALSWPDGVPPAFAGYDTWSNWQDFHGSSHHLKPERLDREIGLCRRLGLELFILDYDWFPRVGDWWSDPERFPEGVEAVAARVKDAGMKFGLWMGFGQAHPESRVAREHPDWLVTRAGTPLVGGWNLPMLCLGYPPCRDWVLEQVSGVVARFGVDWLKHDFDLIPVSDAHHHAPLASDSRVESVLGYYHVMERLHERFPRLYLDNWTPPLGGADFGLFRRHHSMLTQDWYSPVTLRGMLAGITHLFPHSRLHAYLRTFSTEEERDPRSYRSGFFGNGLLVLNDILLWDEATIEVAARQVEQHKADRVLFRDGEVHDLLGTPPGHWGWEARFVYSSSLGRGMAQVFRNHDRRDEIPLRFRGLEGGAPYEVAWEDAGARERVSGAALMDRGVSVRIPRCFGSEVLRLRRA
jgi:alpha-galactosidase